MVWTVILFMSVCKYINKGVQSAVPTSGGLLLLDLQGGVQQGRQRQGLLPQARNSR